MDSLIDDWNQQLKLLSNFFEIEPRAVYSAFVGGFKEKLRYFMRKIPKIDGFLKPLENTIRNEFIPELTYVCSDNERQLLSLPTSYGCLGIPIFFKCAQYEYNNSRKLTSSLLIKDQNKTNTVDEHQVEENQIINKLT